MKINLIKTISSITSIISLLLLWGVYGKTNLFGISVDQVLGEHKNILFAIFIFSLPLIFIRKNETGNTAKSVSNVLIVFFGFLLLLILLVVVIYRGIIFGCHGMGQSLSCAAVPVVLLIIATLDIAYLLLRKY